MHDESVIDNEMIMVYMDGRAYGKAGNRNEMETGNRNGNKRRTSHWCNVFFIVCLVITLVFYSAI